MAATWQRFVLWKKVPLSTLLFSQSKLLLAWAPQPKRFADLELSAMLQEPSPKPGPQGKTHSGTYAPGVAYIALARFSEKRSLAFHPLSLSSPAAAFCPCSCIVSFIRFRFQLQGLSSKFLRHSKILSLQ